MVDSIPTPIGKAIASNQVPSIVYNNNQILFNLNNSNITQIDIFDIKGKMAKSITNINEPNLSFSHNTLKTGIYTVVFNGEETYYSRTIMIP